MATNLIQCPVCGENMMANASFCPSCSFEIHILPDAAPRQVKELEEMRIENAKRGLSFAEQKLSIKDHEIARLTQELQNADTTVQSRVASLEKEVANLQGVNAQLQSQLKKGQEDLAVANQQIKKLKTANESVVTKPETPDTQMGGKLPLAYLIISKSHEVRYVIGINEGENSFGTDPSNGTHRQVLDTSGVIEGRHFVVNALVSTNAQGRRRASYKIVPANGHVYRAEGDANIITGEDTFGINDPIYVGDYSFVLLDNKDNKDKR